jgi:hypothetical protein
MLKGYRVDIKSTRHRQGRLLCTTKVNPDVDIYALAIITDQGVEFPGYATKDQLIQEKNLTDLGYGKGYALTQDKLNRWKYV